MALSTPPPLTTQHMLAHIGYVYPVVLTQLTIFLLMVVLQSGTEW